MSLLDRLGQKLSQLVDNITLPDALREELQRGESALTAGRLAEAQAAFQRVVGDRPDFPRGWYLLGLSQLRHDQHQAACSSLQRAVQLDPESFAGLVTLAEAQRLADQHQAALASYKAALRLRVEPGLLDRVYGGLGQIYLQRGDLDHARRELRKAVAASQGNDLQLLGLLGLAQLGLGELGLARQSLSRAATAVPPEASVLRGLLGALLALGQPAEARLAALRLLEAVPEDPEARCALARCYLLEHQVEAAHRELLRCLAQDAHWLAAYELLAQVSLAVHDPPAALNYLEHALTLTSPSDATAIQLLSQVLALKCELEPEPTMTVQAQALLNARPQDPLGLACLALACPDQPERALTLAQRSLAAGESYAGQLALGQILLGQHQPEQAIAALQAALRISPRGATRARRLLEQAYGELTGLGTGDAGPLPLYSAVTKSHRLLLTSPRLAALSIEAARIKQVFDRPLLVTVMGEFNSGKSTFVNALIGEQIAPMGVTPTTATINVLKYGAQRSARVLWRDESEQLLPWEAVGPFLRHLTRDQAQRLRLVELLYPAEELLRVNVVDTPGFNSMVAEHEQVAREVMGQADAVIWLFSADQAGKQTEQQALEFLKQYRLKTVGVLNKIDHLSPGELAQVSDHLQRAFGHLVETVLPVSARQALQGLTTGQAQLLAQSRFPQLRQLLEQQLFARSRRIKWDASRARLIELLARARQLTEAGLKQAEAALGLLNDLIAQLPQLLAVEILESEEQTLQQAQQALYRQGASEVLDFVRPRRWVLGEHQATEADRDFLQDLLLEGIAQLCQASHRRMADHLQHASQQIQQQLRGAPKDDAQIQSLLALEPLTQLVQERIQLLWQQVYMRHRTFTRGFLQGGWVQRFFEDQLPRLDLAVEPIYEALRADPQVLHRELIVPLKHWFEEASKLLAQQLQGLHQQLALQRLELELKELTPLLSLQNRLEDQPSEDPPPSTGPDGASEPPAVDHQV